MDDYGKSIFTEFTGVVKEYERVVKELVEESDEVHEHLLHVQQLAIKGESAESMSSYLSGCIGSRSRKKVELMRL